MREGLPESGCRAVPLGFLRPGTHKNRLDVGPSLQRALPSCNRWEAPTGPTPGLSIPHLSILDICSGRSEAVHRGQVMNLCSEVMEDPG